MGKKLAWERPDPEAQAEQRRRRGAIDFDIPEAYVELGEDRRIESISTSERSDAHRMIEECMIAANISAARFLRCHEIPALYRVHDKPAAGRLEELKRLLATFGISFPQVKDLRPRHFARCSSASRTGPMAR